MPLLRRATFTVVLIALLIPMLGFADDYVINQTKSLFDKDAVTVKQGDKLIFRNNDDYTHNIQIVNEAGDINDRGLQKSGQNIDYIFGQAGHYLVRCNMHRQMHLEVTVK
ncbi:MAG: hypothetical protein JO126_00125 [Alphaproteobacteria bacterium]|nr:hypothetical protein [Alphaproteobacteria bacterium]MBV8547850.1 hypothetical protein [Alphaproteobacteria bacterium]